MRESQETFVSHLIELRSRLIKAIASVVVVFLCLVYWAPDIYSLLAAPMLAKMPEGGKMIATDVAGAFLVPMKVTLMTAFLISLPIVLYQAWAFVAPGLYVHERRLVAPLIAASVFLFFCGMAFAYFLVFPAAFGFFNHYAPAGVAMMTDIDKYFSFVMSTFMAFGITFEVPVIVVLLVRVGIVSIAQLKDMRRYVLVGAFVVGAIFTPPDIMSQFMLAIPLYVLYELGILFAGIIGRPDNGPALEAPAGEE